MLFLYVSNVGQGTIQIGSAGHRTKGKWSVLELSLLQHLPPQGAFPVRLRSVLSLASVLAVSTAVFAAPASSFIGSTSTFSLDKKTQVPGDTLKPGAYKIEVLDQLSDRMIVRVDSTTSKDHAIFLAVPSTSIPSGSGGAVNWDGKLNGAAALRGYTFGPNSTVEFVYPKGDAVSLAKQSQARVVAIDPQSEGRPTTLKNLSKDDLQVVNLWMLSLTTTGVDNKTPAILARKFTPDSGTAGGTDQTVVARNRPAPAPAPVSRPATTQIASLNHDQADQIWDAPSVRRTRPVMAKLPKTGSDLPLIWMVGLVSLAGAAGVRFGRMAGGMASRG